MTRRAYTLIELLLVLAVLAVIAGMAWPAVVKFSGEQAIKDAAEEVRSELDRTRFRAIDAGLAYQFRYEPNGRRFVAVPAEMDVTAQEGVVSSQPVSSRKAYAGEIREGLTFQPNPADPSSAESISADWLKGLPDAVKLSQTSWSPPILYQPDGTGTTARFRVTDEERRYIELGVRDLTGMASAGPLSREASR